jgi:hypothetical protein
VYAVSIMKTPTGDDGREEDDLEVDFFDERDYRDPKEIDMWELPHSLCRLALFSGDMFLRMQANNLGLVDRWLIDLEKNVQQSLLAEERIGPDAMFLSAITQMWIFAVYEVLRTWHQRSKDVLKLVANSGLHLKINSLEEELGYQHHGREARAKQMREVQSSPELVVKIEKDLRRTHILYGQLDFLRVALAKHEVKGRPNVIAFAPGYARIDELTGSLVYELSNGPAILGYLSRREISDGIRAIDHDGEPQSAETLASFDRAMKGVVPSE